MVPQFLKFGRSVLRAIANAGTANLNAVVDQAIKDLALTEKQCQEKTKSGTNTQVRDRARWAMTHLAHAGLISVTNKRGEYALTNEGREVYDSGVEITRDVLMQFPSYLSFALGIKGSIQKPDTIIECTNIPFPLKNEQDDTTPTEKLEFAFAEINQSLACELLEHIKSQSPRFFEKLVVELLKKMGYGQNGFAETTQYVKDGGIDGIISEDKLGLNKIYVQAKRWDKGGVGIHEVSSFVGALGTKPSKRGVFITTSHFTKEAKEHINKLKNDLQIVLIDGEQLAEYMIEFNLGVSVKKVYELKKIDLDFFDDNE